MKDEYQKDSAIDLKNQIFYILCFKGLKPFSYQCLYILAFAGVSEQLRWWEFALHTQKKLFERSEFFFCVCVLSKFPPS